MKLDFLAGPAFGWIFIWTEIIIIYLAFLHLHHIAEKRHHARKSKKDS